MENKSLYRVVLLLGSNLPFGNLSSEMILEEASKEIVDALLPDYLEVESLEEAVSSSAARKTEPFGNFEKTTGVPANAEETPKFFNQVLCCVTDKGPFEVLFQMQRIEKLFGRVRTYKEKGVLYQNRTLDIDILKMFETGADNHTDNSADNKAEWVELKIDSKELTLPHPQVEGRPFVKPLMAEAGV